MTFDAAHAVVRRRGHPDHAVRRRRPQEPLPDDAAGRPATARAALLATTDIVLPVSDEMDCRACHASGTSPAAEPAAGWVNDPDPERDYRLNILRLHDELERRARRSTRARSRPPATTRTGSTPPPSTAGTPVLCAACHASNALPGTGVAGRAAADAGRCTRRHADVTDPPTGLTLATSRQPRRLLPLPPRLRDPLPARRHGQRGGRRRLAGHAVPELPRRHERGRAPRRAGLARRARLPELPHRDRHRQQRPDPLHLGRSRPGQRTRTAADPTFATNPDTPAAGLSLYRFSTRSRRPAVRGLPRLDARRVPRLARATTTSRRSPCRATPGPSSSAPPAMAPTPVTVGGGPHGMHPVGQAWVDDHQDAAETTQACRACHGTDYRGTVLSRAQGVRT